MKVTEVNVVPIKPSNGLVAIASVVIEDMLYLGSIGVYVRLKDSTYRVTYPTKQTANKSFNVYHPIRKKIALEIERAVTQEAERLLGRKCEKSNEHIYYEKKNNKSC